MSTLRIPQPSRIRVPRFRPIYLAVIPIVVIVGFPLYWMLDTALTSSATLYIKPQSFLPSFNTFHSLGTGLGEIQVGSMFANSAFIAIGTSVLSVFLGLNTAYALSRFQFRGRGVISLLLFATQMVPEGIYLIPIYTLFISVGLVDNLWGLVLVNVSFTLPVSTFIIKAGIDMIPFEIEEAARIDNCPRFGILMTVLVPLIVPSIASAAVLAGFSAWGELMFASTFLTDQGKWPASVQLEQLVSNPEATIPIVMAVSILYSLPAIVFFLIVQRRIVTGLTAGAVKG
jgi:multiple sugar transport system permease protein